MYISQRWPYVKTLHAVEVATSQCFLALDHSQCQKLYPKRNWLKHYSSLSACYIIKRDSRSSVDTSCTSRSIISVATLGTAAKYQQILAACHNSSTQSFFLQNMNSCCTTDKYHFILPGVMDPKHQQGDLSYHQ